MAIHPVQTVPLPGDADRALAYRTRRVIARDGRLTWAERAAKILGTRCATFRWRCEELGYGPWPCNPDRPCESCVTVKELPDISPID